jgi:hypothetical protein
MPLVASRGLEPLERYVLRYGEVRIDAGVATGLP